MIRLLDMRKLNRNEIFARKNTGRDVSGAVREILSNVAARGDEALREYTLRFDGARVERFEVTAEEIDEATRQVDPDFLRILRRAEHNITRFHEKQVSNSFILNEEEGIVMGQKVLPLERVGIYVPGGTAAYPSTVLMDSIPARIAGCREIIMVTPPGKDGNIPPAILAAAKVAGITRIFRVGGAQAVAALAYGTESIPKVDKIVGPGNAYVAEAKRQVYGMVSIDMIAGPSEILIVSDGKTNPACAAADLLSQAEHDKNASAVLVTDDEAFALKVQAEVERQLPLLKRCEIARASVEDNGKIILAQSLQEAIEVANEIAPEHLELCVEDPFRYLSSIRNAGSIFMGRNCPEALGDYMAGPNHTLPTSGTARFSSPLGVEDFVKRTQYTYFTKEALATLAFDVKAFAEMEGLTAHAKSAVIRLEEEP